MQKIITKNKKEGEIHETAKSPNEFKQIFSEKHKRFSIGQQDAIEFIRIFLDDISKENNLNKSLGSYKELDDLNKSKMQLSKEYDNFFKMRENSFIIDLFYIRQINFFTCNCGYVTYSFEKYLDLPLLIPLDGDKNLKNILKDYLKTSTSKWEKPCLSCNLTYNHTKDIKFNIFNEI